MGSFSENRAAKDALGSKIALMQNFFQKGGYVSFELSARALLDLLDGDQEKAIKVIEILTPKYFY